MIPGTYNVRGSDISLGLNPYLLSHIGADEVLFILELATHTESSLQLTLAIEEELALAMNSEFQCSIATGVVDYLTVTTGVESEMVLIIDSDSELALEGGLNTESTLVQGRTDDAVTTTTVESDVDLVTETEGDLAVATDVDEEVER